MTLASSKAKSHSTSTRNFWFLLGSILSISQCLILSRIYADDYSQGSINRIDSSFTIQEGGSSRSSSHHRSNNLQHSTEKQQSIQAMLNFDGQVHAKDHYHYPENKDDLLVQHGDHIYSFGWDNAPIIIEQYKLAFFTTAKVGCTEWKRLFRRMMNYTDWRNTTMPLPWNPECNGLTYLYHYDRETASKIMTSPSWTRAIMLRDPKERFLSAYLDKVVSNAHFTKSKCCPTRRDCVNSQTNFSDFLKLARRCENEHWAPQSRRIDAKYWPYMNFVGHMDSASEFAERLLRHIGAWEEFGASGWGPHGNESIFLPHQKAKHATSAKDRMKSYYSPELEREVDDYCHLDYLVPYMNMTKRTLFDVNKY